MKTNLIKNESNIKLLKYGIPKHLRKFIWEIIIKENFSNNKYFNRIEIQREYNSILYKNKNKRNTQIEKDLHRTLTNEKEQTEKNLMILKNILLCLNSLMKDGYCQGINFVAAFILKIVNFDEIFAYYIIKNLLPNIEGYFSQDFPLLKKNQNIFNKLFDELFPNLSAHFKKNEVYSEFWISRWLQTLFTISLPFDELCPIWDLFLLKGFDFIIYISLAVIKFIEKDLLKLNDSSDILDYINNFMNSENLSSHYYNNLNYIKMENNIILISQLIEKALNTEQKIKNKNILKKLVNTIDYDDCDSIYTTETKASYSNPSSYSSSISGQSSINKKITPFVTTPNSINFLKYNLQNNKKTYVINNGYNYSFNKTNNETEKNEKISFFYNIDLKNMKVNNQNVNKYENRNYDLYFPPKAEKYLYYNNAMNNNYLLYNNFLI